MTVAKPAPQLLPDAPTPHCDVNAENNCIASATYYSYEPDQQSNAQPQDTGTQDAPAQSAQTQDSPKSSTDSQGKPIGDAPPGKQDSSRGWVLTPSPVLAGGKVTLGEEFFNLAKLTVGPRALFGDAFSTGIHMARPPKNYPPEWRQGAQAFGRIYGSLLAVRTSRESAQFLTGAVTHEDLRYKRSASKNPFGRTLHAIGFTFVDQSYSGHSTFAFSNFTAAAAGGFIGKAYLPAGYNDLHHAEIRSALGLSSFATRNLLTEFSPEIGRMTRHLHLPRIPIPAWWTSGK